jgi:hypothetical protein
VSRGSSSVKSSADFSSTPVVVDSTSAVEESAVVTAPEPVVESPVENGAEAVA